MNRILLLTALVVLSGISLKAQENKTVIEETVVKKVTTRDTKVAVKEVKETTLEKGEVVVDETSGPDNLYFKEDASKDASSEVLKDEVMTDEQNAALIQANKEKQQAELENAIRMEQERLAKERAALAEKEKQRLLEMEANKKKLEKRGRKMAKLKKKKKRNN